MAAGAPEDPWGTYTGVFLQQDQQLIQEPMDRLAFLGALAPIPGPELDEENVGPGPEEFLKALRTRAKNFVDPELLVDREKLWSEEPEGPDDAPEYMYLKGETNKSHEEFHRWVKVIKEDLGCDARSCREFQHLFSTNPPGAPHGFQEANRVLAHILKDKIKSDENLMQTSRDWSAFMAKACRESIEALQDHDHVKDLRKEGTSWADFGRYPVGPPGGPGASSSSSSSWQPHGKGPDYNKGKGKGAYQQGYR